LSNLPAESGLRVVFAGTPPFAAGHLSALIGAGSNLVGVLTQPDRPAGRGKKLQASAVKQLAVEHGLPVYQPESLKTQEGQQQLADLKPDLLVVVAYGLLLPQPVLDTPRMCCINVHASLLPRWRGAAPIERAMLAGDRETGVTIMKMDAGLDTGAMLLKVPVAIEDTMDRNDLEKALLDAGCSGLLQVLRDPADYLAKAVEQDHEQANYADKLQKSESAIDWQQSATSIGLQVRALTGRFPTYTQLGDLRLRVIAATPSAGQASEPSKPGNCQPGEILTVSRDGLRVCCGQGVLDIQQLQLPGKKVTSIADLLNARATLFSPGDVFGEAQHLAL
jgi:methionyl-tRNA formyltransferase